MTGVCRQAEAIFGSVSRGWLLQSSTRTDISGRLHSVRFLCAFLDPPSRHSFACRQVIFHDRPHAKKIKKDLPPRNRHGTSLLFLLTTSHAHVSDRMSKSSTATASKPTQLPTKSAWSKGPPQTTAAPSPRSASPAPNQGPSQPTHSRRPSVLGQGVSFKDGARSPTNTTKPGVCDRTRYHAAVLIGCQQQML